MKYLWLITSTAFTWQCKTWIHRNTDGINQMLVSMKISRFLFCSFQHIIWSNMVWFFFHFESTEIDIRRWFFTLILVIIWFIRSWNDCLLIVQETTISITLHCETRVRIYIQTWILHTQNHGCKYKCVFDQIYQ